MEKHTAKPRALFTSISAVVVVGALVAIGLGYDKPRSIGENAETRDTAEQKRSVVANDLHTRLETAQKLRQLNRRTDAVSLDDAIAAGRRKAQTRAELLDAVLAEEEVNAGWEAEVLASATEFFEKFENTGLGTTELDSLQCGNSLCKIVFRHASLGEQRSFFKVRNNGSSWNNSQFGRFDNDGEFIRTVIYSARAGESLPSMTDELEPDDQAVARSGQ